MNEKQEEHIESIIKVLKKEIDQCRRGINRIANCEEKDKEYLGTMITELKLEVLECAKGVEILKQQVLKYEGRN